MFRVLVLRLIFKRVLDSGRFAQMIQYTAESRPCMGVVLTFSTFPGKKKKSFYPISPSRKEPYTRLLGMVAVTVNFNFFGPC